MICGWRAGGRCGRCRQWRWAHSKSDRQIHAEGGSKIHRRHYDSSHRWAARPSPIPARERSLARHRFKREHYHYSTAQRGQQGGRCLCESSRHTHREGLPDMLQGLLFPMPSGDTLQTRFDVKVADFNDG